MSQQLVVASVILSCAILGASVILHGDRNAAPAGESHPGKVEVQGQSAERPVALSPAATRPVLALEYLLPADEPLVPGDIVEVSIPDLSPIATRRFCRVGKDGNIDLWIIGNVAARGRTSAELEKDIAAAYKKAHIFNDANVEVTPQRVSLGY